MPTPFTHLQIADAILKDPHLDKDVALLLQQYDAAFYFGSIAPDFQAITEIPRIETHFYTIPPEKGDLGYLSFWQQYDLGDAGRLLPAQAVCVAAYSAHLLFDVRWYEQVLDPCFVKNEYWQTWPERYLVHNILLTYMDQLAVAALPDDAGKRLQAAVPEEWLPFAVADLERWRDLLARQLQPGAAIETVEIYAGRMEMTPEQFTTHLQDEEWLHDVLFAHVNIEDINGLMQRVTDESVALLNSYLEPLKSMKRKKIMTIKEAPMRKTIQVRFPDGRAFNGPSGETVEAFIEAANLKTNGRVLGTLVNGKLRELSQELYTDVLLHPITMASSDGVRIYRRSMSFLTVVAARKVFDCPINIHHSMPFGGYYCERADGLPVTADELAALKKEMQGLIDAALPIAQLQKPLADALAYFRETGQDEKAELFTRRRKDYLTMYELDGFQDNFHGFMVPNTRYLNLFDLHLYATGFIFHFPRRQAPDELQPFEDEPWLAKVFKDYDQWLTLVGIPSVPALNTAIAENRIQEAVLVAEALHARQLASIAHDIATRTPKVRVVLISGPTSAGKTTFSKRLAVQLIAQGVQPATIGMDNYFVNRENTPRDENGDYDYESIEAVDVPLFVAHLQELMEGKEIIQPLYNFHTGHREKGSPLQIGKDRVIIIEGIHGLNPKLVAGLASEHLFRIFISAFTQLNLDRHNRVPTTDTRLIRRIVRDAAHRGYSAADTIQRWQSVRRGEKNHIFPFQHHADAFFNSALVYELAMLKPFAQPLLLQVEPDTPERVEANRLLAFLQWFDSIKPDIIPYDSILREFVGGSIMEDFEPWRQD